MRDRFFDEIFSKIKFENLFLDQNLFDEKISVKLWSSNDFKWISSSKSTEFAFETDSQRREQGITVRFDNSFVEQRQKSQSKRFRFDKILRQFSVGTTKHETKKINAKFILKIKMLNINFFVFVFCRPRNSILWWTKEMTSRCSFLTLNERKNELK